MVKKNKVLILFLVFFITLSSFIAIINLLKNNNSNFESVITTDFVPVCTASEKDGFKLVIDGLDVTNKCNVILNDQRNKIALPILFISFSLGAEIHGDINEDIEIKFSDEAYILNGVEKSFTIKNQKFDIIQCVESYAEDSMFLQGNNEIFIESDLLEHYMYLRNYDLNIDLDNKLISLKKQITLNEKLFVNNKSISSAGVRINNKKEYAELPIVRICEALGAQVEWYGKRAYISFGEETYELDIDKFTLYESDSNFNLLTPPVGGQLWTYYRADENELFVDTITLGYFFYKIGVLSTVDTETNTVVINQH